MARWPWLAALAVALAVPVLASTYSTVEKTCPVGGQKFKFQQLGSISTWDALPDGMPIGSGLFPIALPLCPGNGLVMFRDFTPEEVAKLAAYIEGETYRGLRASGETPYYLAFHTARMLGDVGPDWLLLSASWEAKNAGPPAAARAARYNEEFVGLAKARPADPGDFESIALRARAANALRELGRFDEAEALRASIVIASDAGGDTEDAKEYREGWTSYLDALAAPIARADPTRAPIDMMRNEQAAYRCLARAYAAKYDEPEPPALTPFEVQYCARPELAGTIAELRKELAER
ncbi:hypothetical protein ABS767_08255 [Sphingomonas sp. ST-64]|uniref:Tetratricopeptide repeat-containing protein n=1 Tax=Sphingomonas plantiphila TaxID=3163295 RepID=A0ABW8YLT2_9SPHN